MRIGNQVAVTRIAGQHVGVVIERLAIGSVGAKLLYHRARHAIDVLGGRRTHGLAGPAGSCLDAEKIVARAAVGRLDLVLAPAALQGRLAQHELGGNAGGLAGRLGMRAHRILKRLDVRRLGLAGRTLGRIEAIGLRLARRFRLCNGCELAGAARLRVVRHLAHQHVG